MARASRESLLRYANSGRPIMGDQLKDIVDTIFALADDVDSSRKKPSAQVGPKGDAGAKGEPGPQGDVGPQGPRGLPGEAATRHTYEQSTPSNVWTFANPFNGPCAVEIIDSSGSEIEAQVDHDGSFSTITITMNQAFSGKAVLT